MYMYLPLKSKKLKGSDCKTYGFPSNREHVYHLNFAANFSCNSFLNDLDVRSTQVTFVFEPV